jgi:hypothetical protein
VVITAGGGELKDVSARSGRETIGSAEAGGSLPKWAAGSIEQVDGDASQPGLARILEAVAVQVFPDRIAEGGILVETGIYRRIVPVRPVETLASLSLVSSLPWSCSEWL